MNQLKKSLPVFLLAFAGFFSSCNAKTPASEETAATTTETPIEQNQNPAMADNTNWQKEDGMYVQFNTTKGEIVCKLEFEKIPVTVANFVALAEGNHPLVAEKKPFYDGLTFHRVIANFMIQGGDPAGNGTGGPPYKFGDEFDPSLKHTGPGVLSMANAGPGTNGSQFFITHVATPWLDGKHTIFGHVVVGQSVVNAIQQGDKMTTVKIIRVGKAAKSFDAPGIFAKREEMERKKADEAKAAQAKQLESVSKGAKKTASGLMYIVEKEGTGAQAVKGKTVSVHYTGTFLDGTKFDSSLDRGQPLSFILGQGQVIPGWDEGIALMKVGTKMKLIIPSDLAYGARGVGPIPPNTPLIFETELMDVK
ncbi:MAG: peptidylprolyl isomerase [Chitinophagales bacterium]